MQRLRFKLEKSGVLSLLSHLELMKAFARALRRTGMPVAFSQGYSPHPKISFASALPVGVASRAEYVDVEFSLQVDPGAAAKKLCEQLPEGLKISAAAEVELKAPKLMARIEQAGYTAEMELTAKLDAEELSAQTDELLAGEVLEVEREGKRCTKVKNIRPGIKEFRTELLGNKLGIEMLLASGSKDHVRPREVLEVAACYLPVDVQSAKITRTGLYILENGRPVEPLNTGLTID